MKEEFKKLNDKKEDMIAFLIYLLEKQENLEIEWKIKEEQ